MRTPEQIEAMVPISDRSAQRFPRLRETQLELVRRFANAEERRFAPGEKIFEVGDRGVRRVREIGRASCRERV